ncbi:MAG: high-potential iron-sulfur protein [Hyphomonas sp.]
MNIAGGAAIVGLVGCSKSGNGLACATPETLTTGQRAARDGRKYVEASKEEGKDCLNCSFYKAESEGCGVCAIDGLAANPAGFCTSWSAQTASRSPTDRRKRRA